MFVTINSSETKEYSHRVTHTERQKDTLHSHTHTHSNRNTDLHRPTYIHKTHTLTHPHKHTQKHTSPPIRIAGRNQVVVLFDPGLSKYPLFRSIFNTRSISAVDEINVSFSSVDYYRIGDRKLLTI